MNTVITYNHVNFYWVYTKKTKEPTCVKGIWHCICYIDDDVVTLLTLLFTNSEVQSLLVLDKALNIISLRKPNVKVCPG